MLNKKYYFIIICSFFVFITCKKERKTSFSQTNITIPNNTIVEINIPKADGDPTVFNPINLEVQKNIIASLQIDNTVDIIPKSIEEGITLFNKEYEVFKTDFPETPQPWEAQIDGEVMYQSLEVISIAITSYINTGGAHGTLNISFLNFESQTGKLIPNNKLIKNNETFKKIAKIYFEKAIKDEDILFDFKTFELPLNIGYNEKGIILLYNIFQIEPYSAKIIEFTIPYNEAMPYLIFNSI